VTQSWQTPSPLRVIAAVPKIFLALLLVFVMLDLLAGVLLRYVVVQITDYFDLDPISFFWVEEVGEFGLAWLAAVGAAVAIIARVHFALRVVTHRFAPRTQRIIDRVNHLLIAGFGAFAAFYGSARTFSEFFREPDAQIGYDLGPFTRGQLLSFPMLVVGFAMMITYARRNPPPKFQPKSKSRAR